MSTKTVHREVVVPSQHLLRDLLGTSDSYFRMLQESFPQVQMVARGANVSLRGPSDEVGLAESVINELLLLVQEGTSLAGQVGSVVQMVRDDLPDPAGVLSETLSVGRGKLVRVKTHRQLLYVQAIRKNTATFAIGPAGTGKTYLAMAAAVEALTQGSCRRIILTRPAVEAGERLGFLPGDLSAKVDPYLRPLYDALWAMLGPVETARLIERGTIEIAPLAYMRGRTLNDACVILDEAQNTSPEQMKMFLTRLGFNSKMIVTGDLTQTDLPFGRSSGLDVVREILGDIPGVAFVELTSRDVIRHRVVADIIEAYHRYENSNSKSRSGRPRRADYDLRG
ncbi:MAG: PhoH family protein [Actinomycetia bacterium]|nr:PhoH family protein [Actinomycetes bacterium]